jgi:RNA-directed DNA polymerase
MLKSKHPNKNLYWIRDKYFTRIGQRNWCFFCEVKTKAGMKIYTLIQAVKTKIKRHLKIKGRATPFDDDYKEYFAAREDRLKKERIDSRIVNNNCLTGA